MRVAKHAALQEGRVLAQLAFREEATTGIVEIHLALSVQPRVFPCPQFIEVQGAFVRWVGALEGCQVGDWKFLGVMVIRGTHRLPLVW